LKASYARYLVSAYKRGKAHDTELLLTSASLNHMFIRSKYLKAFTGRQKSEAEEIRERQEAVQAQKMLLESKVVKQKSTVNAKQGEELTLKRKAEEHKELLDQVREDKAAYQAELRRKQAAAAKIERLIADLIERERAKRAESGRRKGGTTPGIGRGTERGDNAIASLPSRAVSETAFGRLKGQLPWPLAEGRLVTGFGDQTNPKLGTVIPSNGIDIAASPGAAVRVVADGTISMLYFIAGYGNLLIVNHDDGFRTVYAHLSGISVREGQRVRAGQTIARSAEGITGAQVHFELWREKNKLNPLSWLAKR
jgi:septal ring factor EnvC (AmiA/AmiB activator)